MKKPLAAVLAVLPAIAVASTLTAALSATSASASARDFVTAKQCTTGGGQVVWVIGKQVGHCFGGTHDGGDIVQQEAQPTS